MKFSICIILLTISESISSPTQSSTSKATLNEITEKIYNNSTKNWIQEKFGKYFSHSSFDCVKDKLKLSENGDKKLFKLEAEVLATEAVVSCSGHDKSGFWKSFFEDISKELSNGMDDEDIKCIKFKLQKLNLKSKLLKDFDAESMNQEEVELCEDRINSDESSLRSDILSHFGTDDLSVFTCGVLDFPEVSKIMCTIGLLASIEDTNTKDLEIDELSRVIVEKLDQIFICRMNKLPE